MQASPCVRAQEAGKRPLPPPLVYVVPAKRHFYEWAMLGSNQRPLPCEGEALSSSLFATVQEYQQHGLFSLRAFRDCSPLFVGVGVLLV